MNPPDEQGQVASTGWSPALPTGQADETTGTGSAVIPAPTAPQVPGSSVQPVSEVLNGELITEAEYARRRGRHRLPVLAAVAVMRESDRTKKVTTAVVSRIMRCTRVVARAVYTWARVT